MSQMVNMRYPKELLDRIDKQKEKMCFTSRTQTIIYLVQYALTEHERKKK